MNCFGKFHVHYITLSATDPTSVKYWYDDIDKSFPKNTVPNVKMRIELYVCINNNLTCSSPFRLLQHQP